MKSFLSIMASLSLCITLAQTGSITGHVISDDHPVAYATIKVQGTDLMTATDEKGSFTLTIHPGKHVLIAQAIGYKTTQQNVQIIQDKQQHVDIYMAESSFDLNQVVITASRNGQNRTEAPVIVTVTNSKVLQRAQALSLSEGLSFQPGLRLETNCQNCGFTQVRMNGLEGAYSQILMDSRPIFSALNGVYGLDQIPTNMIERIEVVRGGGSSLYGSNAIAGTINIISKNPIKNSFEINTHLGLIDGKKSDNALSFNGTILTDKQDVGLQIYGMTRNRDAWDANNDGFTEITSMENQTFGLKSFYQPSDYTKWTVDFHQVEEFRRGGEDRMDLQPYEVYSTEQIRSKMIGGGLKYEQFSKNEKTRWSAYFSTQNSKNNNFYGGRVDFENGDMDYEESLKGYGKSDVNTWVLGTQISQNWKNEGILSGLFTTGFEYKNEEMIDEKPGYDARVSQHLKTFGWYAQQEFLLAPSWKLTGGIRADFNNIAEEDIILNPRVNLLHHIKQNLQWRTSYARGFRAPQVFSEDIHARIAAGEVTLVQLASGLKSETSDSYMTSLDYTWLTDTTEGGFTLEAFYTQLNNPFILEQLEETIWEKRNGDQARVYGINMELKYAPDPKWQFQWGGTLQKSEYETAVQWSEEVENTNKNFFRSPNVYSNIMITYAPTRPLQNNLTAVYTGSMLAPHYAGYIAEDRLETTSDFVELNWKTSYTWYMKDNWQIQLNTGIQNILNQYQKDFDRGVMRDANYIYGPSRPRTFFIGVKIGTDL